MGVSLPPNLADLVRAAQAGSQEAATELYECCSNRLAAYVGRKISALLHRLYDAEDFVIDTLTVVCNGRFAEDVLQSAQRCWYTVLKIARDRLRHAERDARRERRDLARDLPLEAGHKLVAKDLEPDKCAILNEGLKQIEDEIQRLPEVEQAIIGLWRDGHKPAQIAVSLGIDVQRVYRTLAALAKKLGGGGSDNNRDPE